MNVQRRSKLKSPEVCWIVQSYTVHNSGLKTQKNTAPNAALYDIIGISQLVSNTRLRILKMHTQPCVLGFLSSACV